MAKKITHLITGLEGGTEHYLYQLLSGSAAGWDHEVLLLKNERLIAEVRALGIPLPRVAGLWDLARKLRRRRPDVPHTCLFRTHQVGRLIGHSARLQYIVTRQQAINACTRTWHRRIETLTLPWADSVVVNSHAAERLVTERRGRRHRPHIVLIEKGLDPTPPLPERGFRTAIVGFPRIGVQKGRRNTASVFGSLSRALSGI